MEHKVREKFFLSSGALLMGLAVVLGAFGAHGLEGKLTELQMSTYQTGVQYHLIHALAMLWGGLALRDYPQLKTGLYGLMAGIILFSGFCYLYALTGTKIFAMVVPFGGVSFIAGWSVIFFKLLKTRKSAR